MNEEVANEIGDYESEYALALAEARNTLPRKEDVAREYLREQTGQLAQTVAKKMVKRVGKRVVLRALTWIFVFIVTNPVTWIVVFGILTVFTTTAVVVGFKDCITSAGCWKDFGIWLGQGTLNALWKATGLGMIPGVPNSWFH